MGRERTLENWELSTITELWINNIKAEEIFKNLTLSGIRFNYATWSGKELQRKYNRRAYGKLCVHQKLKEISLNFNAIKLENGDGGDLPLQVYSERICLSVQRSVVHHKNLAMSFKKIILPVFAILSHLLDLKAGAPERERGQFWFRFFNYCCLSRGGVKQGVFCTR